MGDNLDQVASAITGGTDHGALRGVDSTTDGEYADSVFKKHEEGIKITRKESYVSAANLLRLKEAKEGKKEVEWDKLTVDQLTDVLNSSTQKGLSEAEAKLRFERDGPN